MRLSDQLRQDLRAWQLKMLAKYEQPGTWDQSDPDDVGIFARKDLPARSEVRAIKFKEELEFQ